MPGFHPKNPLFHYTPRRHSCTVCADTKKNIFKTAEWGVWQPANAMIGLLATVYSLCCHLSADTPHTYSTLGCNRGQGGHHAQNQHAAPPLLGISLEHQRLVVPPWKKRSESPTPGGPPRSLVSQRPGKQTTDLAGTSLHKLLSQRHRCWHFLKEQPVSFVLIMLHYFKINDAFLEVLPSNASNNWCIKKLFSRLFDYKSNRLTQPKEGGGLAKQQNCPDPL